MLSEDYIVHQNSSHFVFFRSSNGNFCGMENLPKTFQYSSGLQCKNRQINETEVILGDSNGHLFVHNLEKKKKKKEKILKDDDEKEGEKDDDEEGDVKFKENHHVDRVLSIDCCKNSLVVSGSRDDSVCIWDFEKNELIKKFTDHSNSVYSVMFLGNESSLFASGSSDKSVKVVDYGEKMEVVKSFEDHEDFVYDLSYCEEKKMLFSCSKDQFVNCYDLKEMKKVFRFDIDKPLNSILYLGDNYLFSGDYYGNLYCLDIRKSDEIVYERKIHDNTIHNLLRRDNKSIITGSIDKHMKIVNSSDGKELMKMKDKNKVYGMFLTKHEKYRRKELPLLDLKEFMEETFDGIITDYRINSKRIYDNRTFNLYPAISMLGQVKQELKLVKYYYKVCDRFDEFLKKGIFKIISELVHKEENLQVVMEYRFRKTGNVKTKDFNEILGMVYRIKSEMIRKIIEVVEVCEFGIERRVIEGLIPKDFFVVGYSKMDDLKLNKKESVHYIGRYFYDDEVFVPDGMGYLIQEKPKRFGGSVYNFLFKGTFRNGLKSGLGWEFDPKTRRITYMGEYIGGEPVVKDRLPKEKIRRYSDKTHNDEEEEIITVATSNSSSESDSSEEELNVESLQKRVEQKDEKLKRAKNDIMELRDSVAEKEVEVILLKDKVTERDNTIEKLEKELKDLKEVIEKTK